MHHACILCTYTTSCFTWSTSSLCHVKIGPKYFTAGTCLVSKYLLHMQIALKCWCTCMCAMVAVIVDDNNDIIIVFMSIDQTLYTHCHRHHCRRRHELHLHCLQTFVSCPSCSIWLPWQIAHNISVLHATQPCAIMLLHHIDVVLSCEAVRSNMPSFGSLIEALPYDWVLRL